MKESLTISLAQTKQYITDISSTLIESLKEIVAGDWGLTGISDRPKVFLLDIEISPDGYGMILYPCDKEITQLGYKKILAKYPDGPLRDISYKHKPDLNSYDFDNEEDLKELDEYYGLLTDFYISWVASCWEIAGGLSFQKPIFVMMHDNNTSFDLLNKKWVDDNDKWPE